MDLASTLLKAWEVPSADLTLGKKLGEGGQATVFQGKWRGTEVAIKQARMRYQDRDDARAKAEISAIEQTIRREVRAL